MTSEIVWGEGGRGRSKGGGQDGKQGYKAVRGVKVRFDARALGINPPATRVLGLGLPLYRSGLTAVDTSKITLIACCIHPTCPLPRLAPCPPVPTPTPLNPPAPPGPPASMCVLWASTPHTYLPALPPPNSALPYQIRLLQCLLQRPCPRSQPLPLTSLLFALVPLQPHTPPGPPTSACVLWASTPHTHLLALPFALPPSHASPATPHPARSARFYVRALGLNPSASHVWGYLRTALACAGHMDLIRALDDQDLATLQARLPLTA